MQFILSRSDMYMSQNTKILLIDTQNIFELFNIDRCGVFA